MEVTRLRKKMEGKKTKKAKIKKFGFLYTDQDVLFLVI